eukprot:CAMPEP_0119342348 /NCGR_PEP_ID=MMETSP1333-20130426/104534_1 /TAXON_ID=418940 /ORGANISM="Scyphosphaera apsteinii, Strain RCC1455" /LENGTH=78 /DNA_ID=CAMNT_0007354551 /DNA_START=80 /DNA_END=316 /DNA_ORIENTATION=+
MYTLFKERSADGHDANRVLGAMKNCAETQCETSCPKGRNNNTSSHLTMTIVMLFGDLKTKLHCEQNRGRPEKADTTSG